MAVFGYISTRLTQIDELINYVRAYRMFNDDWKAGFRSEASGRKMFVMKLL